MMAYTIPINSAATIPRSRINTFAHQTTQPEECTRPHPPSRTLPIGEESSVELAYMSDRVSGPALAPPFSDTLVSALPACKSSVGGGELLRYLDYDGRFLILQRGMADDASSGSRPRTWVNADTVSDSCDSSNSCVSTCI